MRAPIRISRLALQHNVQAFRRILPTTTRLMAVVKSNAYGHGVALCAPVFARSGVQWFGVASLHEALALRPIAPRASIVVLSYLDADQAQLRLATRHNIQFPAYTVPMLKQLNAAGRHAHRILQVHLKLDTGTTRVGFLPAELPQVIRALSKLTHLEVVGVYSHFAEVESRNQVFSQQQHERFATHASQLETALGKRLIKHMDCSAGALVHADAHYDMVRIGMSLYGIWTVEQPARVRRKYPAFSLQPALQWHTSLVQVKNVPPGTTVGYNRTYRFARHGRIGVLPVGYWDGLDRSLSNAGHVYIAGHLAPIRGRVCMNLTMVDLTHIPRARVGSTVELIGLHVPVERMAAAAHTIPYETLTRMNPLAPRELTR